MIASELRDSAEGIDKVELTSEQSDITCPMRAAGAVAGDVTTTLFSFVGLGSNFAWVVGGTQWHITSMISLQTHKQTGREDMETLKGERDAEGEEFGSHAHEVGPIANLSISLKATGSPSWTPRLMRIRSACVYLGMNKNTFNTLVRPSIKTIPLGKRAIAFDRLELDA